MSNPTPSPIILVPGIKGTTLVNTNTLDFDTIWSGVQSKFETIFDLELKDDPRFETSARAVIERGDAEDLAYKEAVVIVERKTGRPIYIFGYDWRKSCQENGKRLKAFVEYLKEKLPTDRFNFITHSLGGVVFSCYLKELNNNFEEIDHTVLTVCPFQGSIMALVALLVGEGGINFPLFNPNDMFRKIARTFPAVYELCPTYPGAVNFEPGYNSGIPFDLFNPKHWQTNISGEEMFLKRLSQLKAFRDQNNPAILNLGQLPEKVRSKTIILVGEGEKTTRTVTVKASSPNDRVENFFDFEQEKDQGDGDGTVPLESSTIYKDKILTLSVKS
ncbi:MAG: hypothetical protein C0407_03680, partial [Desulfobacca sp.]|nr:hypothetical protein [Desulfobacca sp.]